MFVYEGRVDIPPAPRMFTETPGPNLPRTFGSEPEDFFCLFFNDHVWQFLVQKTNEYAHSRLATKQMKRRSLY